MTGRFGHATAYSELNLGFKSEARELHGPGELAKNKKGVGYIMNMKISMKPLWNQKFTDEQFLELYRQGLSDEGTSKKLKVHRVTVRQRRTKLRLPPNDPFHKVFIPVELTPEGAYILGALLGDKALISKRKIRNGKHWKTRYIVSLAIGRDNDFGEAFLSCIRILFRRNLGFLNAKGKPHAKAIAYSKAVYLYVARFIDLSWRAKTWRVPEAIKNASDPIKSSFLKGLFDAEASAFQYSVTMMLANKPAITDVTKLLESLGIDCGTGCYYKHNRTVFSEVGYLRITGQDNLRKFLRTVGFSIKRKNEKLKTNLENCRPYFRGRSEQILACIKGMGHECSCPDIAHKLGIDEKTVSYTLKRLKKKGAVTSNGRRSKWAKWTLKEE